MPFRGNLWQVAALAVVFALVLPGIALTLDGTTDTVSETDTVTAKFGSDVPLSPDQTAINFYDNETVTNNDTSTQLEEGVDYDFDTDAGTLEFNNTGAVNSGDNITVDYSYNAGAQATAEIATIFTNAVGSWFGILFFVVVIGALFSYVFENGGGF